MLASAGRHVIGYDIDVDHLRKLNAGKLPFFETGLEENFTKVLKDGKLQLSDKIEPADVFIICVPTPLISSDTGHGPDTRHVFDAIDVVSEVVVGGELIIIESTCPVGTTSQLKDYMATKVNFTNEINFAYCPERVLPGAILNELVHNDRVVGGLTVDATKQAISVYESFVIGNIYSCTAIEAEICKLAENSYRDVNIAFANELSQICDSVNVNPLNLIQLANRHPRVNILKPGPGVGGHCIAVDPWFLVSGFPEYSNLIRTARLVNSSKTEWVIKKIFDTLSQIKVVSKRKPTTAILGLSYKENVGDLRESPAMQILDDLKSRGENVVIVEPHVCNLENIDFVPIEEAIDVADLIVVLVAHDDFQSYKNLIKKTRVLDFCGYLSCVES
jgi:UDP-N-acetyl-D-mannosaminuronic acid dehydrogenase